MELGTIEATACSRTLTAIVIITHNNHNLYTTTYRKTRTAVVCKLKRCIK